MKILHVCLGAFYIDNYSYQENLLPKYHKKSGYEVSILASKMNFDSNGKMSFLKKGREKYINENDIEVTRIDYKYDFLKKIKIYKSVTYEIKIQKPDIIFIHGLQFFSIIEIVKYLKENKNIKIYIDNHCDYSNSAKNWLSKNILHKVLWKYMAKKIEPFTEKFYGVLPARVDFLVDTYKLPKSKVELLVMGADDELVEKYTEDQILERSKKELNIKNDDIVIVTGGKIDLAKQQTLLLMKAVININNPKLKLIIFGNIAKELQERFNELCKSNKIQYLGWATNEESYKYFSIADLVVFPGRHSVYWEQGAGMGKPMILKYWEGIDHLDNGGNVKFIRGESVKEIEGIIEEIVKNVKIYEEILQKAQGEERFKFLYSNIANRSISQ